MSEKKRKPKAKAAGPKAVMGPAGPMNVDFLQQLINLMASNDLNTVELRDSDRRIILKRGAVQVMGTAPVVQAAPVTPSSHSPIAPPPVVDEDANLVPIKSPMVGTFYSSSSPDAKAFVSVGSVVDEETDVCIIEAMKVFNNIKAETRGTIAKILVTNGQTVEFGTVLFLVKPN